MSAVTAHHTVVKDVEMTLQRRPSEAVNRCREDRIAPIVVDFERQYREVHRYLVHRVFDAELADELAAETFYKAATAEGLPTGEDRLRAWLLRVATNLATTHYRKKRLHRLLLGVFAKGSAGSSTQGSSGDRGVDDRALRVRAAVAALRPKVQAVVVLRYYSRLSVEEISTVLGCRSAAVRARLSRGVKELRRRLGFDQVD